MHMGKVTLRAPQGTGEVISQIASDGHVVDGQHGACQLAMKGYLYTTYTGEAPPGECCMHRAECEPGSNGSSLRVTVVSKAFEGKTAKRREKLVLKARLFFFIKLCCPGPTYMLYMHAMHKHTAHISLRQLRRSAAVHSA